MSDRVERFVRIDPVGFTANIRLVVRQPGFLAAVADLDTGWDHRVGARGFGSYLVLPPVNSVYFHVRSLDRYEHSPCRFLFDEPEEKGCRMELAGNLNTRTLALQGALSRVLVREGSEAALAFLEENFFTPRLHEWLENE